MKAYEEYNNVFPRSEQQEMRRNKIIEKYSYK